MKRIGILLTIFSTLAIFTYRYEELGGKKREELTDSRDKIFDSSRLGELKEIVSKNFHLIKKNEFFYTKNNRLVDRGRLEEILNIMSFLKVKRYLNEYNDNQRDLFFKGAETMALVFENTTIELTLGRKLEFDHSFYMEIESEGKIKRMISYDSSIHEGTYHTATFYNNAEKFNRLKTIFVLPEEFFEDTHLFAEDFYLYKAQDYFKSITIENQRNKRFSLYFDKTIPAPPDGISLKNIFKFKNELLNLKGIKHSEIKNIKVLATITADSINGKKEILFGKSEHKIYISLDQRSLEIDERLSPLFFKNVQDFWSLQIAKDDVDHLELKFPNLIRQVKLKRGALFKAESLQANAKHKSFKLLDELLKTPANRLSYVEKAEKYKSKFGLKIGNHLFDFYKKGRELIAVNMKEGYKLHFENGIPFELVESEFFE